MSETETPVEREAGALRRLIRHSEVLLDSVAETLTDLLERVRLGESTDLRTLTSKQSELETALKRAVEIERRYDEWQTARTGELRDGEIDLDAVRDEVGRRLARLRAAGDAGELPG